MQPVRLGRVLLVAAVSALIPLAGKTIETFLTEQTSARSWLVVPAVGVAVAMATALVEACGSAKERGQTPLVIALLVSVVVIGLGGLLASAVVRPVVGSIKEGPSKPPVERFVLEDGDLPGGYTIEETTASFLSLPSPSSSSSSSLSVCSDNEIVWRDLLFAHGFKRCTATLFGKTVQTRTVETNRVSLMAYLVRDTVVASKFLSTLSDNFSSAVPPAAVRDLGNEAMMFAWEDPSTWLYIWRRESVVAVLAVQDFSRDFNAASVLKIARRVDDRGRGVTRVSASRARTVGLVSALGQSARSLVPSSPGAISRSPGRCRGASTASHRSKS